MEENKQPNLHGKMKGNNLNTFSAEYMFLQEHEFFIVFVLLSLFVAGLMFLIVRERFFL